MTQKGKQGKHGNAIREMAALRWELTHVTKHHPRVVPLQYGRIPYPNIDWNSWAIQCSISKQLPH